MYDIERQKQIIDILKDKKSVSVKMLTELVYASPATVRRDLAYLEKKGLIKRTFGGAIIADSSNEESATLVREQTNVRSKRYICEKCSSLISNNQSIFMDSSTTLYSLVPFLCDIHYLSIITNGVNIATLLSQKTNFRVILAGGTIADKSNSTLGPLACMIVSSLHCDMAILSCTGFDINGGVTETAIEQSQLKQAMMNNADVKILLCDSSKFGKTFLSKTAEISAYNIIITDKKPDEAYLSYCERHQIKLIY